MVVRAIEVLLSPAENMALLDEAMVEALCLVTWIDTMGMAESTSRRRGQHGGGKQGEGIGAPEGGFPEGVLDDA